MTEIDDALMAALKKAEAMGWHFDEPADLMQIVQAYLDARSADLGRDVRLATLREVAEMVDAIADEYDVRAIEAGSDQQAVFYRGTEAGLRWVAAMIDKIMEGDE